MQQNSLSFEMTNKKSNNDSEIPTIFLFTYRSIMLVSPFKFWIWGFSQSPDLIWVELPLTSLCGFSYLLSSSFQYQMAKSIKLYRKTNLTFFQVKQQAMRKWPKFHKNNHPLSIEAKKIKCLHIKLLRTKKESMITENITYYFFMSSRIAIAPLYIWKDN